MDEGNQHRYRSAGYRSVAPRPPTPPVTAPDPLYKRVSQPSSPPPRQRKLAKKLPLKRIGLGLITAATLITAGWLIYGRLFASSPIPKAEKSQLHTTAYYPKALPASYSVDTSSFTSAQGQGFSFNILHSGGETIGVTEQVLPKNLDLNAPDPGGVQPETFQTPIGQAEIRAAGPDRIGYIVAGNTFIIFNLGNTPATDFQAIAKDFKKA